MSEYFNVADIFGEDVFTDKVMQERLPKKVYKALKKTIEEGKELDLATADVIAAAMKDWAIEKGATHYTRFLYHISKSGWFCFDGVFRKRADQRGAGCFFFPVRRTESDLRGERIYSMGLHVTGFRTP